MRLSNAIKTYAKSSGITIDDNTVLSNEVKGVGSFMLMGGIIILLRTAVTQMIIFSFTISIMIFIGFAI